MAFSTSVFERSSSLVTRELGGEKIIVPVRGRVGELNSIYTLNAVANEIWEMLDGKCSVEDIIRKLGEEFDVDEQTLSADVTRVMNELQQEGLVRQV